VNDDPRENSRKKKETMEKPKSPDQGTEGYSKPLKGKLNPQQPKVPVHAKQGANHWGQIKSIGKKSSRPNLRLHIRMSQHKEVGGTMKGGGFGTRSPFSKHQKAQTF